MTVYKNNNNQKRLLPETQHESFFTLALKCIRESMYTHVHTHTHLHSDKHIACTRANTTLTTITVQEEAAG